MIQIFEIALFLIKKGSSIKDNTSNQLEGLQMSFFDLNQTCETVFTEHCEI